MYQYRAPIDLTNPRLRKLAAALGRLTRWLKILSPQSFSFAERFARPAEKQIDDQPYNRQENKSE